MVLDYKILSASIVVLATWLSFRGQGVLLPQWIDTLLYYFMIFCSVYMISSRRKEQNTLRIINVENEEGKVLYKVDRKVYTEKEIILWIVQKMDVDEKEAKRFLDKISERKGEQ